MDEHPKGTENIVPNGNINAQEGISPSHSSAKYISPHIGNINKGDAIDLISRTGATSMDKQRKEHIAYEYLCHLEEAKNWMEACIEETLPPASELDESLRTGVILCKLGHWVEPETLPLRKIYDLDGSRFEAKGLHFKHTDNFNFWLKALKKVGLPEIFYPETTDLYDKKNMPRVIYCIHALSLFLHKLGKAPEIENLVGTVEFTEEEISAMQMELDKYGIHMPSFGKIGGILAKEMSVDEAAIHAAVVAINSAIESGEANEIITKLNNPFAALKNINNDHADRYVTKLLNTKESKCSRNHEESDVSESDAYDFMLTQSEIQACITDVNTEIQNEIKQAKLQDAVKNINMASDTGKLSDLLRALQSDDANLEELNPQNLRWYLEVLNKTRKQNMESDEDTDLSIEEIQDIILMANEIAEHTRLVESAIVEVNGKVLEEDLDSSQLLDVLQNENLSLRGVSPDNIDYYWAGMKEKLQRKREESGNSRAMLTEDELQEEIHSCNRAATIYQKVNQALIDINTMINEGNDESLMVALTTDYAGINNVQDGVSERYYKQLQQRREEKGEPLTREEISEIIERVNEEVEMERLLNDGVNCINDVIVSVETTPTDLDLLACLQNQHVGLKGVESNNVPHYRTLLKKKQESISTNLSRDEIQSIIETGNEQTNDSIELAKAVCLINSSIHGIDPFVTFVSLNNPILSMRSLTKDCTNEYHTKLGQERTDKRGVPGWAEYRSKEGYTYYYNVETDSHMWTIPEEYTGCPTILTREEIQTAVSKVTADYDRWALLQSNEPLIIRLQSRWRGILVRQIFRKRLQYLNNHEKQAIVLQAHWKGYIQRKRYGNRAEFLRQNITTIIKIQSLVKMYIARRAYRKRLAFFRDNIAAIVRIQTFWRGKKTKKEYKQLVEVMQPPASAVRKFLSLLEQSDVDFTEEIECQRLKSRVVQKIRSNQQIEQDLNVMDIKIGLLVRNRITLEDVVLHTDQIKKNRRRKTHEGIEAEEGTGLGGLSKSSQEKVESYQHLFYLLQTDPNYFAKLIFEMSPNKTNKFMENVILTVLNYAHDNREQYLLVRLFETALIEEIQSKVDALKDIVTGNPTVIKMVVHFTRSDSGGGTGVLKELLNPLVEEILSQDSLVLNISPVDVYKSWINQMESDTGEKSKLPYDVSNDKALSHEEVRAKIATTVQTLQDITERFQTRILQSVNRIPYVMRYIAMRLREALHEKFPEAQEDDILKVVGNLFFFRYMNPAIVAPDAFDIIEMGMDKRILESEQRRNLGAIAKVLQHAAAEKLFEGENAALATMNGYIKQAFQKFKQFFLQASTVEPPSVRYGYDEYTDVIMLTKPVIYITVKELIRTHTLLVEHEDALAPDQSDPLRELLVDLGQIPSVEALLGGVRDPIPGEDKEDVINAAAKQELTLTLSNKFEAIADDGSDMKALFVRTKRMVVDLLRVQPADNLTTILYTPATPEQEEEHQRMSKERDNDQDKLSRSFTIRKGDSAYNERDLPLEGMKRKIMRQLRTLEQEEMVTSKNDYQDIISAIAKDIRNQHRHRQQRKQELKRLQETSDKLNQKALFFEGQLESYHVYVKACLESLAKAGGKGNKKSSGPGAEFKRQSIKYSAQRLYEKGVVLEIEGLPKHQFRNASIELTAVEHGVFEVTGRVLGVAMDKVELVFQDLLQLQYEGVSVMKMFGRAKINVNLLIFLINKKFYGTG